MLPPTLLATLFAPYEIDAEGVEFIRYSQNYAYAGRRHGKEVFVRIARDRHLRASQVEAEQAWVTYLADRGINVCRPIRSREGRWCEERQIDGSTFVVVCLQRVPGHKMSQAEKTPAAHAELGRLTAQLHSATLEYAKLQAPVDRPQWYASRLLNQDLATHVPAEREAFHARVRSLMADLPAQAYAPDAFGLIHADISFGNCTLDGERLWIFDFDNCEYAPFIADFATMLYDSIFCALFGTMPEADLPREVTARWNAFHEGYAMVRAFGPIDRDQLRQFLILREAIIYVHYMRVMSPERKAELHDGLERMRRNVEEGVTDVTLIGA